MRLQSPRFASLPNVIFYILAGGLVTAVLTSAAFAGEKTKAPRHMPGAQSLTGGSSVPAAQRNAPPPATTDTWTGAGTNADWSNASNWNDGAITSGENILINLTTAATTVDQNFTIGSLTLSNAGDSATINGGVTLTVANGISNAGTLTVGNGSVLNVSGNISGAGAVDISSSANTTELVLSGNVTLSGGTLTLSNNSNNYIFGATALDQLNNQETISGSGHIGNGQMSLVNSGTINSNGSAGLAIDANDGMTNTGTVEATLGSTLQIVNTTDINTGGTINANASTVQINGSTINGGNVTVTGAGTLQLNNGTIVGGTITNSATGTIAIASGSSNVLGGTIVNPTGGVINVENGAGLNLQGGTYAQLGAVQLNSTVNATQLVLQGNVTLSGGSVTLSNSSTNYIYGSSYLNTLTNNETISGAGHLGNGQMTLVNTGTINSNQSAGLNLDANGGATNTGMIEATGGSTLSVNSTTINNAGGTLSANASTLQLNSSTVTGGTVTLTGASTLQLNNATINGGTITNSATGTISIASGSSNYLGGTINNSAGGVFSIANGAGLNLEGGTYSQLGNVQLNSSVNTTQLVLQGDVTLSGGSVTMSNSSTNYIYGGLATDVLTNNETISGAGHLGNGSMGLINTGTINSNQSSGMAIDANYGVTNSGTLEATAGSTLAITSSSVNNTGGNISANTGTLQLNSSTITGGTVALTGASTLQLNNATVIGGTITNSATGTISIASGSSNYLGGTINNSAGGLLSISNGAGLNLEGGTYSQLGAVQLNSSVNTTALVLQGSVTLSGGSVTMSNSSTNYIYGGTGTDVLTNQETISGAGTIGNNSLTLVNQGTINANQSAGMTINPNFGVVNTGTMEATAGSNLIFSSTNVSNGGGTVSANTGTIQVNSATITGGNVTLTGASTLDLNNGVIHGGDTITNSSTGTIAVLSGSSNVLGGTINNSAGGILAISNGASLHLQGGNYAQLGNVQLNSSVNTTALVLQGSVTLSGGAVTMSNSATNYIYGGTGTDLLNNQETISGSGDIGNNSLTLVNSGTINANGSAGMIINPNGGANNTGTIEATNGAGLTFSNTTVSNMGGTVSANTGTINVNGSTINGGTVTLTGASSLQLNNGIVHNVNLTNSSTGTIVVASGTGNTLGGTINNSAGGVLSIANGAGLNLDNGNYTQLGAVQLNSSGNTTQLVIGGNVTLSGGTVTMSGNANNFIYGAAATDVLTNAETIQGAGNIGNAQMGLVNSGTILANASGNLVIDVSGMNFNNTGIVEAKGATLTIEGPGVTFLTNDNQSTGTLTGGTYIANGSNIQWNAGANNITTLAANVTEEGGGELVNTCTSTGCNSNMLAGLTSITSAGSLTIGGLAFTDAGAFSNAGSLTILSGESFSVGSLSQISSGSLTAGTYVLDSNLNITGTAQTITKNAATLTLAGGTIENTSNSTNALAALATNSGKLTIGGTSNNVSTTAASFSNTGTLTINGGDSFTTSKLTQVSGTTLSAGTYVLSGNLDLTTATNITTNSATLTLSGGTIQTGSANDLANLASNTKSLTVTGNASVTTGAAFTNTGTMSVAKGSTFTVSGGKSFTQSAGTTTVDGTLSAGTGGISVTGGTLNGAGTLIGNTSNSGTINVGDSGKAGLLAITGTYSQLSSGALNASIGGATLGTQYSQLQITGAASLGGTLTVALLNSFTPTVGQTFTILTASSVSGSFTNSTIAINSTEQFDISYTSTGVVLTVVSTGASNSNNSKPAQQDVAVSAQPILRNRIARATSVGGKNSMLRSLNNGLSKRILVAGLYKTPPVATAPIGHRIWENIPVTPSWNRVQNVTRTQQPVLLGEEHSEIAHRVGNWTSAGDKLPLRAPIAKWTNIGNSHHAPLHIALPVLPMR